MGIDIYSSIVSLNIFVILYSTKHINRLYIYKYNTMFAALEAIKNTFFSIKPVTSTVANQVDAITSIVDDDNDSTTEPIIDQSEPIATTETVEVFDKRPYIVTNLASGEPEDFHYLQGENLSQTYDFCLNKTSVVKIHICMVGLDFQCNYSGEHLPFLRFLMEYGQTIIDFTKCEIMCNSEQASEPDESKIAEMDIYFHNECKKRLLDFFVIEGQLEKMGDVGELLNKSYLGYKEMGEGQLVAVFDITSFLNIPLRKSANPVWIVLNDLENQVLPFSPKVLQFFKENEYMKQIRDPLNNLVETPKSLYLYDTENTKFMMKSEKSEWLDARSLHPIYGNFYYFKPLTIGKSETPQVLNAYRKCVVFLKNYADFLENDESIVLNGEQIPESAKSIGGNNSDISLGDVDVDDLELSDDSDVETQSQNNHLGEYARENRSSKNEDSSHIFRSFTKENDKSEIQNNLPFVSLIMFSEKGEHTYCVKTESIFAEL
jgi:hypothetical protein